MNVLIVMNNSLSVRDNRVFTDNNTYHIIERFAYLGKIRICAPEYSSQKNIYSKRDKCLEFIGVEDVAFVRKARMFSNSQARESIGNEVKRCDLVIGYQSPCVNAETALYYAKKYKKRYMSYVVACAWDGLWNHSLLGKICAPYRFLSLRRAIRLSDYALYVTSDFLQRRYPNNGINVGCSDVIINFNREAALKVRLNRIAAHRPSDIVKLVTVGAVDVRYKGQEYVIKALGELKTQGVDNIHYYLIGGGNNGYLTSVAENYGVRDHVHFVGTLSHSELFMLLDEMDIYIQPSLTEGLPRSVVEAMSRGLVCLGSEVGGIPELLDEESLFKSKSIDGIACCIEKATPAVWREWSLRSLDKAAEFDKVVLDSKRREFFDRIIENCKK